jgi:Plasmid pRiA4b ORF-3-like protein
MPIGDLRHAIDRARADATPLGSRAVRPENGGREKLESGTSVGQDSVLEVRVVLIDSEPEIWRLLGLRGSLALSQVHRVLQAAFGWEVGHLHRFVSSCP